MRLHIAEVDRRRPGHGRRAAGLARALSFPAEFVKHDYDLDRSQYLAFTFVRHPIDRFASFYRDKVHGGWDAASLGIWRRSGSGRGCVPAR